MITLLPPDKDHDAAMSRMFSDAATMKYLGFMVRHSEFTKGDAKARRLKRDKQQQQRKELLNYTIAIKKSQIPAAARAKIEHREFLSRRKVSTDRGAIEMDEPFLVIGCCGLNSIDLDNRCSAAGIILDARFWRSGASTEALYLTLKFGFEVLCLHRIAIETTETNDAMRGWMENVVGVEVECIRKEALYLGEDEYMDSWDYAIFDQQWYVSIERRLRERIEPMYF
ncbi:hypothetical protein GGF46_000087 [Coemansia sp. RSA 552]|nr:hypothetical protein GGF46_000087 [Coemansia sp. RSA 552]